MAKTPNTKTVDLRTTHIYAGKYYGPGKGVDVPEDFRVRDAAPEEEVPAAVAEDSVESDVPAEFPGRAALIEAGHTSLGAVRALSRDELLAIGGIGERTAEAIEAALKE